VRWRQTEFRAGPAAMRLWQSHKALRNLSHSPGNGAVYEVSAAAAAGHLFLVRFGFVGPTHTGVSWKKK